MAAAKGDTFSSPSIFARLKGSPPRTQPSLFKSREAIFVLIE